MSSLQSLAHQVNGVLGDYVKVHDAIFTFSIRKLLPIPGLFEGIDYCGHEVTLRELSQRLQVTISQDLSRTTPRSAAERAFVNGLTEYATALLDTIERLQHISEPLCRKSHGDSGYSYNTYDADVKAYDASVQRYVALGQRLNALYSAL